MAFSNAEKQKRFRMKRDAEIEYLRRRMLLGIFAVYDSAISTWMAPFYMRNKGEALRWWQEICNNPESKVAKHPGDFTLFELGTWDDDKCLFSLLKTPIRLGVAMEFMKSKDVDMGSQINRELPVGV